MTEDKIVLNLIDFYKSRGINLDRILDDPIFKNLSLETKLAAIRKYADAIAHGTKRGITKSDVTSVLGSMLFEGIKGGAAAFGATVAASKLFGGGKPYFPAVAGIAAVGALTGATLPILRTRAHIADRNKFYDQAQINKEDPSERNAFHTLALRSLINRNPTTVNPQVESLLEDALKTNKENSKDYIRQVTKDYNEYLGKTMIHKN